MAIKTAKEDSSSEKLRHINEQLSIYITTTQNNFFNIELLNRFGKQDYYKFRQMVFRLGSDVSRYENLTSDAKAIVRNNSLVMAKVTLEEIEKMPIAQHVRARFESTHMTPPLSSKHLPQETTMNATSMVKEETQHPTKGSVTFSKSEEISTEAFFEYIGDKVVRSFKILKSPEDSIYEGTIYSFVQTQPYMFQLWLTPDSKGNYTYNSLLFYRGGEETATDFVKVLKELFVVHDDPIVEITPTYSNQPKGGTMKERVKSLSDKEEADLEQADKDHRAEMFAGVDNDTAEVDIRLPPEDPHPEKTIGEIHKEVIERSRPVFSSPGAVQREKITFIDPSELPPETVEGFEDLMVVTVARHYGITMICHSANGVRHYSVFRLVKVVGVYNEPVNGKVLMWIKVTGSKPSLKIIHVPKVDLNGWVKEEDLLFSLLPLESETDTLDPVLEAALRCAPKEVLQSYLEWGMGGRSGWYPTLAETLAYLQGG